MAAIICVVTAEPGKECYVKKCFSTIRYTQGAFYDRTTYWWQALWTKQTVESRQGFGHTVMMVVLYYFKQHSVVKLVFGLCVWFEFLFNFTCECVCVLGFTVSRFVSIDVCP